MRVICITQQDFDAGGFENGIPGKSCPDTEEILDVLRETICMDGVPCYEFKKYLPYCFDKRNFSILSSIDETEMIRETNLQKQLT